MIKLILIFTLLRNSYYYYNLKPSLCNSTYISISVLSVCRRRYKGHQNQLKYCKFPSSLSPPLELIVFRFRYSSSLSPPLCRPEGGGKGTWMFGSDMGINWFSVFWFVSCWIPCYDTKLACVVFRQSPPWCSVEEFRIKLTSLNMLFDIARWNCYPTNFTMVTNRVTNFLTPCPSTGSKMYCAGPIFLEETKTKLN